MSTVVEDPRADEHPTQPIPVQERPLLPAPAPYREPRRRSTWTARFGAFVLIMLALVGTVSVGGRLLHLPDLLSFGNPFTARTTDRSTPPLLESVRDLNRFEAAEGTFQVVIDLEKDRKYVPGFLMGERTLFVASGQVQAYVDFAAIGSGAVVTAPDGAVTITLPEPTLGKASLDLDNSHVYAEQRGFVDRVQDVFSNSPENQREIYQLAEKRITDAAEQTELVTRAESNTRTMLTGLLRSLGHSDVTVRFTP
ncbi:MAG: hypothetical protein JWO46_1133 [Nocardioidaceae bacterium]|nr:hypothetical protein [Nocardioidaceae bacterium]